MCDRSFELWDRRAGTNTAAESAGSGGRFIQSDSVQQDRENGMRIAQEREGSGVVILPDGQRQMLQRVHRIAASGRQTRQADCDARFDCPIAAIVCDSQSLAKDFIGQLRISGSKGMAGCEKRAAPCAWIDGGFGVVE